MSENKLVKIGKIFLYLTALLPLIYIPGLYYPFIITKVVYFRLLIEAGLTVYILLLALNWKKYKPTLNAGTILVAVFFFCSLISGIFGYDFYKSFWSYFERMDGIIGIIYLTVFFFLLPAFFREKKDWLFYIRCLLGASLFVSIYGLVQKFDILPVFQAGVDRVAGTIGNAAFLAGFLLLAIGLGVYYYFNEEKKNYRYFALATIALNLIVLAMTLTRGAILGLCAGVLFYVLLNSIFAQGRLKKYSIIALVIFIVLGTGFYFSRNYFSNSKIEILSRMASISVSDATIKNRLTVWKMAWGEFKSRPVLGIGMENFDAVYNKNYTPDINEDWFDRTHNIYFDQLVSGGVLGLAAYLAIFFYLFFALFKKRKIDTQQFAVISSLLVAYGIHNFFVFDTINTSFVYYFLIGLVCFGGTKADAEEGDNIKAFNITFLVVIVLNLIGLYALVYLPFSINRHLYTGYYYIVADTEKSYENFKNALDHKFGGAESAYQICRMYDVLSEDKTAKTEDLEKFYALLKDRVNAQVNNYPLDVRIKLHFAQILLNYGSTSEEYVLAEKLLKDSIELTPYRPESYYLLYNLYSQTNETAKAKEIMADYVKKLPWFGEAKIMLAMALVKDDKQAADKYFNEGLGQYYRHGSADKQIVAYLIDEKKYKETEPYYQQIINGDPKNYGYRLDLAKIYYLTGDLEKAVEQVNIVSASSPETLESDAEFVNTLFADYNKLK